MSSGSTRDLQHGSAGWLLTISIPVILVLREVYYDRLIACSEWNIWSQFVVCITRVTTSLLETLTISQAEGVQQAFQLDSLRASHPIEVPVRNALEVDQIFDHISYLKGSSVIRMLSHYLGQETFLRGVADYLKTHAYGKPIYPPFRNQELLTCMLSTGNATTNDLWSALSKASNRDVNSFMVSCDSRLDLIFLDLICAAKDPWIRKIGFPVVTVAEEPGQISIRQNRFLSSGDAKPEEDETTWWIPLGIKSDSNLTDANSRALASKADTIQGVGQDTFYKINKDLSGFYRTNYPVDRLAMLGQSLARLSTEDKIGLIGDAAALAVSGEGTTAALLALLEGFKGEQNYLYVMSSPERRTARAALMIELTGCGLRYLHQSGISALFSHIMNQCLLDWRDLLLN